MKGDLVRIDGLPFMQRIPGLPEDLPKGQKVRLKIFGCDLVDLIMDAKLLEVLPDEPLEVVEEDEDEAQTEAESAEETSKDGSAAEGAES